MGNKKRHSTIYKKDLLEFFFCLPAQLCAFPNGNERSRERRKMHSLFWGEKKIAYSMKSELLGWEIIDVERVVWRLLSGPRDIAAPASKLKRPKNSSKHCKKDSNFSILSSYYFPYSSIKPMINGPVQLMLCTEYRIDRTYHIFGHCTLTKETTAQFGR